MIGRWFFTAFIMVTIGSCGFQLRQSQPLPEAYRTLRIVGLKAGSAQWLQLEREMADAGFRTTLESGGLIPTLRLSGYSFRNRRVTLRGESRELQYDLRLDFTSSLYDLWGKVVWENRPQSYTTTYRVGDDAPATLRQQQERSADQLVASAVANLVQVLRQSE
ncbi:MAG: hypothetical protein HQL48_03175 [Gammaproteobacteria bacterium]|nr:hypothetical protein [Gammaproteobacteria bacterium]